MLDTKLVNFSDIEDVTGFALLICQAASYGGLFLDDRNKPLLTRVRKAAKDWVHAIRQRIDNISVADALTIINIFDPVHRIAYGTPADSAFINRYTLAAFDAYIRPNKPAAAPVTQPAPKPAIATQTLFEDKPAAATKQPAAAYTKPVDVYTLLWQIKLGLNRKDRAYFFRPLQWYTTSLDRWYNDFSTPSTPPSLTPYDTIQRVSILLQTDLRPYKLPNQDAFKQRLFNTHRHLLDNPSTYDLPTLKALYNLLTSSQSYFSEDDFDDYLCTLLGTIIIHPDVNRFYSVANSLSFFSYFF